MHAMTQSHVKSELKAAHQELRSPEKGSQMVERAAPIPPERMNPISMAPIERVRSTSATLRRIENMQKLIGELSLHEMLADEIAWFLKFSPSGARKYIRDLREAGVIELARYIEGTATYLGQAVYQLTPDPERVKAFLAAIVQPKREGAPPWPGVLPPTPADFAVAATAPPAAPAHWRWPGPATARWAAWQRGTARLPWPHFAPHFASPSAAWQCATAPATAPRPA